MQKHRIYLAILAIGLFTSFGVAQNLEIAHQEVLVGANLRQYAIINKVSDEGRSSFEPCPDCVCTVDILDLNNERLVNDGVCTMGENGLASFQIIGPQYRGDIRYKAIHQCNSTTYGQGLVISTFEIETDVRELDYVPSEGNQDRSLGVGDIFVGGLGNYFLCTYTDYCPSDEVAAEVEELSDDGGFWQNTVGQIPVVGPLFMILVGAVELLISLLAFIFGALTLLVTDQKAFIEFTLDNLWLLLMTVGGVFALPLALMQLWVFDAATKKDDPFRMVEVIVEKNVFLFKWIWLVFVQLALLFQMIARTVFDSLKTLSNIIPFT